MMGFFARYSKRLGILAVAALLVVGATLAASAAEPLVAPPAKPDGIASPQRPLSPGMKETRKALRDLRRSHFEKLRADAKALIERAVAEGKITREEADRMLAREQADKLFQKWEAWRAKAKTEKTN